MRVKVWRAHHWKVECSDHGYILTSPDWMWAMEAAWGHIAMHHGANEETA